MLFKRANKIELEIDAMLDEIGQAALLFEAAVKDYLEGEMDSYCQRLEKVSDLESKVDEKRRTIRNQLYTKMLIPESRGDVLSLLENIDNVIDLTKDVLTQFHVERPVIPESLVKQYEKLAAASKEAMNNTVLAARAYFREVHIIQDYINRTFYHEHEADGIENEIKRSVFALENLELAEKMQLRDFAEHIASVSDEAESVCERLSVAAIKRTI